MLLECLVRATERPLLNIRIVCIMSRRDPRVDDLQFGSSGSAKHARNRRQPTSRPRTGRLVMESCGGLSFRMVCGVRPWPA